MSPVTAPNETVRQLSFATQGASFGLAVVLKRTYVVTDDGAAAVAEAQVPLCETIALSEADPKLLAHDTDLVPNKPRTDVIVLGHAQGGGERSFLASIAVGGVKKEILVVGDRRCTLSAMGRIVVSDPERLEKMPVSFSRAYGGRDLAAEETHGNPMMRLASFVQGTGLDMSLHSPFLYPRNLCGTGYLVEPSKQGVERCVLPNLEDPVDRLTPERLVVGKPEYWVYMPAPQGLGWVSWGWFPRLAWAGIWPDYEKLNRPIPEVHRGLLSPEVLSRPATDLNVPTHPHAGRVANGAPLDLQLPYLRPDVSIELVHLHPRRKRWLVQLPGERPNIWTDGRNGKLNPTEPVLQTVVIEPDLSRVTVVWRGSAPAIRPYLAEELLRMPLRVVW